MPDEATASANPLPFTGGEVVRRTGEGVAFNANEQDAATSTAHVKPLPYPIAVAIAAARHGVALEDTLAAYLHAFTSNLIQCAVRLVPLGQRDGVAALASLEPTVQRIAARAAISTLDDLGSCALTSDILSMQHETLYSRVFRS